MVSRWFRAYRNRCPGASDLRRPSKGPGGRRCCYHQWRLYSPPRAVPIFLASTNNQHHVRPSNSSLIGTSNDGANHQYDLSDFWTALDEDRLPAVTYLKAAAYQDAHPGYSDPIDEQFFVVNVINALENSRFWKDIAIIIAYDDSDGWYDHALGPIVNQSAVSDELWPAPTIAVRPKRTRKASADTARGSLDGHLPLCKTELCGSSGDRPIFHSAIHRGQLEPWPDRREFLRREGRHAEWSL